MNARRQFFDALFGREPDRGAYIELRRFRGTSIGPREFLPITAPDAALAEADRLAGEWDTYMGCAPRNGYRNNGALTGCKRAISRVHALYVDADTPEAVAALRAFEPRPSIVVRSGQAERFHAYWPLGVPVSPKQAERGLGRLTEALGSDPKVKDASRILRVPGTLNHKTSPPAPVAITYMDPAATFTFEDVVGALPDPPGWRPGERRELVANLDVDDPLKAIPAPAYVEALTGLVPDLSGKVPCPFHDENTPSCHVYDDPERGWRCFGCDTGGSIIDFGAALWHIEPRGAGYHEIRRRLLQALLSATNGKQAA